MTRLLAKYAALPAALVFYEAPHRIAGTLGDLVHALDGRRVLTVARELTKTFETIARMPLAEAPAWLDADANRSRGEFVLIVDLPPADVATDELPMEAIALLDALLEELSPSRATRVAAKITGLPRDLLYAQALRMKPEPLAPA